MKLQILSAAGHVLLESSNRTLIETVAEAQYAIELRASFQASGAKGERLAQEADIRHARTMQLIGA